MNISNETLEKLNEFYNYMFYDNNINEVSKDVATNIHIGFTKGPDAEYIGKTIKATKKEITFDYIIDKINKDNVYKNFSDKFNTLINNKNISAYPTTYGLGIFVGIGLRSRIEETKSDIENTLKNMGIEYTTEYSNAGYVFRYKLSKKADNIKKMLNN
jgi:hypothetical protein